MALALSVHALVVYKDTYLVLQRGPHKFRYPGQRDLPGGTLKEAEETHEFMQKELMKETGLITGYMSCLGTSIQTDHQGGLSGLVVYYVVEASIHDIALSNEHIAYQRMQHNALGALTPRRDIVDTAIRLYTASHS